MAEDVICLLDKLGWTEERELNVIGISMGGMIAQGTLNAFTMVIILHAGLFVELAYRIPQRICSLVLASTTPGGFALYNLPPVSISTLSLNAF